jgi:putative transposase
MTRRQHSGQFKARVVVEAIRGVRPVNELAARFGVHPVQIAHWRKQALEGLPGILGSRRGSNGKGSEGLQAELYEQIGRLQVELAWFKKKSGLAE